MAVPSKRYALTVLDPSEPVSGKTRFLFQIAPNPKGGRLFKIERKPWQPGDPLVRWRKPLHPWRGGLARTRFKMRLSSFTGGLYARLAQTYGKANIDSTQDDYLLLPPPLVNSLTLTNGGNPSKVVEFNSLLYFLGGRYMYSVDPTTNLATQDKDFGVGKAAVDMAVFNNELIVAMGESEKIWKRTTTTWTQATDATYAIALGVSKNLLWKAASTNSLTNCTTGPLTLANWGPTPAYAVGDSTYAVNTLIDYGGNLWAGKADGMYQADVQQRFLMQTPQLSRWPHTDNCAGSWTAWGFLWVPTAAGLLRIQQGKSEQKGPELTQRLDFQWWVRGGVAFDKWMYLLCTDQAGVAATVVIRMEKDVAGLGDDEYLYHEWARLDGATKGYCITVTTKGTNPELFAGYGNDLRWITLGRGGGPDVDDANYRWGTSAVLETGETLATDDASIVANLIGTELVCKVANSGESITLDYQVDGGGYFPLLHSQEGGGTPTINGTDGWESVIRYAPPSTEGQTFSYRLTGTLTSTDTHWQVREWWAFGVAHLKSTDTITATVMAEDPSRPGGIQNGLSHRQSVELWRRWTGQEMVIQLEDYEPNRVSRFLVAGMKEAEVSVSLGDGGGTDIMSALEVVLVRVMREEEFA